jgi:uncharacterized membrane protein YhaH (DUF805 family)
MTTDNAVPDDRQEGWLSKLLTFRGRIGRGWFLAGLGVEFGILLIGLTALSGLTNPTGGGDPFIAIVFILIAIYVHLCLVTARLRDSGVAHPVPLGIIVSILPFAWILLTLELIEPLGYVILAGFLLMYFAPAFAKSKAVETPQI